ncbi:hypothetical protein MBANPS3_006030 [Mucor bainieri]
MSTSDSPLDTIKDAEASLAKLTMEDKLSHPPPDLVELCSLNIKRLKISDMNVLSEEMTTSDKDQVLAKLYEPDNNILKERIILEPKSIIANLKRKRAKAVLRPVFTNKNISTNVPT